MERLRESWDAEGSVSEAAMCDEAVLGYEDRRQPDWFRRVRLLSDHYWKRGTGCMRCGLALEGRGTGGDMQKLAGEQGRK